MARVVANFAQYRGSAHAWALGRLIIPTARLDEFLAARAHVGAEVAADSWRISALLGDDLAASCAQVNAFNETTIGARLDSVEFRVTTPDDIALVAHLLGPNIQRFAECAPGAIGEHLTALRRTGTAAKIRTGGVTADAFPSAGAITDFIGALGGDVAFKATAGLHHPLRSAHALTYAPDAPRGTMHGFLNVFLAATFAGAGAPPDVVGALMQEGDASALQFTDEMITWRDRHATLADVTRARRTFALSFGSCSFREPIDDLIALGFL